MKKYATLFLVVMVSASSSVFSQTRKETTVKLEWQEQSFLHFYTDEYAVYVSKPDFLNLQNDLLVGLFDEFAENKDSMNLADPFSSFKTEYQNLLWNQLMQCAKDGHMLILPNDSKKKLKSILLVDNTSLRGNTGAIWECRDPRTNQLIFAHYTTTVGALDF